jgi:tRNA(Ile)-lysidine synthase
MGVTARVNGAEALTPSAGPNPCGPALAAWALDHPDPGTRPTAETTPATHPWAVAFSGGADSTALLLAAVQLWPGRVQAFHIHHGLQAAADGFADHCATFCAARGVPLHTLRVNAHPAPRESPEAAARDARYRGLAQLAVSQKAHTVLLGQHAQDQVETVLLALTRGAGLPGLAGMAASTERHGVRFGRPLLATDTRVLRAWLLAEQVAVVDDPTNADQRYTRNRIRARLLPDMLSAFPASLSTVARSARAAAQAQGLLDEVAAADLAQVGNPPLIKRLQALSRPRQANVLRYWLKQGWACAPSEAQLEACLDQVAACTTRGHRIELKVAQGHLVRDGAALCYHPPL